MTYKKRTLITGVTGQDGSYLTELLLEPDDFVIATGKPLVKTDPVYYRPTEVDVLMGNPAKAKAKLGWAPKVKFDELARPMVRIDLEKIKKWGY